MYFRFCFRVSAPLKLHDSSEAQPVVHNLTDLILFIGQQSQPTLEHNLQVYDESDPLVDLDGIKLSFNRSMEPSSTKVSAFLASSNFTAPQDNFISQSFNEPENEQYVPQDTITPRMKVCKNTAPSPETSSLRDTTAERTCTSPFSKLLEQTQGNLTHDETRERTAIHSAPLGSPLPSTTSYVTSTELLALDQKLGPGSTFVGTYCSVVLIDLIRANTTEFTEGYFFRLCIGFWVQNKAIVLCCERCRFCFPIIECLVFKVRLHFVFFLSDHGVMQFVFGLLLLFPIGVDIADLVCTQV